MEKRIILICNIVLIICVICAFALCAEEIQQVTQEIVADREAPAPPTGVRVIQPVTSGRMEQRFENYAPTGDIRMEDGQGNMVEYDINIDNPSEGGSQEGNGWE